MNKHRAIFKGRIIRKIYDYYRWHNKIYEINETIEYEKLEEVDLNEPMLEVGQKIHLSSLDKVVKVVDVIRSTDNSIIYHTNYIIKVIEDDITLETKEKAQKDKEYYEQEEEREIQKEKSKKKWYQFWK